MNTRFPGNSTDAVVNGMALLGAILLIVGLAIDSAVLEVAGYLTIGTAAFVWGLLVARAAGDNRRWLVLGAVFMALGVLTLGIVVATAGD